MIKNPIAKKILLALAVAGLGFVLLNLTFIFDWFFQSAIMALMRIFTPVDLLMVSRGFPPLLHGLFLIVIGLISWAVFRSKLSVFLKAVYMLVPVAVGLATLGMFLYRWPIVVYSLGALFVIGVLYYFYRTKQPWLYYYAVILISLVLAIFTLSGGEI
jgi:hypothetical protein